MAPMATQSRSHAILDDRNSLLCGIDGNSPTRSGTTDSNPRTPNRFVEEDILKPIAIVGFSLKFPQEATSPEAFWEMLVERRCSMTEWPKERLNLDAFYHPDRDRPDTVKSISY